MCAQVDPTEAGARAEAEAQAEAEGASSGADESEPSSPARRRLLHAVVAYFEAEGLADQSLRRIAEAIGTSHRMLLYHFGSRDGLLLAVVREVESRTQERLAELVRAAPGETDALLRRMWTYLADPALGDLERLFFALYGRALQGDEAVRPLLDDDMARWLDANVALSTPLGIPEDLVRTHGRLGLAVTRGLLLDLLATGDRAGVEAAFEVFAGSYRGQWWQRQEGPRQEGPRQEGQRQEGQRQEETGSSDRAS